MTWFLVTHPDRTTSNGRLDCSLSPLLATPHPPAKKYFLGHMPYPIQLRLIRTCPRTRGRLLPLRLWVSREGRRPAQRLDQTFRKFRNKHCHITNTLGKLKKTLFLSSPLKLLFYACNENGEKRKRK